MLVVIVRHICADLLNRQHLDTPGGDRRAASQAFRVRRRDCGVLVADGDAAGLLPRLKDNVIPGSRDWRRARFTPGELGGNPFFALASAFKPALDRHARQVRAEAQKLTSDPSALDELVGLVLESQPPSSELLLFVDQFEELLTVVDAKYRGAFSELLAQAANLPRLRMVATLRADLYHRCVEQPALAELLRAGTYPLAAPGIGALFEMISRPAARAGLSFEVELPERILDDTGAEPGALPLMAFALEQLHDTRTAKGYLPEFRGIGRLFVLPTFCCTRNSLEGG